MQRESEIAADLADEREIKARTQRNWGDRQRQSVQISAISVKVLFFEFWQFWQSWQLWQFALPQPAIFDPKCEVDHEANCQPDQQPEPSCAL
jgi:hypothetical protein